MISLRYSSSCVARTVNEICDEASNLAKKGLFKRFIRQNDQRAAINALLVKLDHAWRIFNVSDALFYHKSDKLIVKHSISPPPMFDLS